MKGFTTKAIHSSGVISDTYNSLRPPVYKSVAFEFDSSADIALAFEGRKNAHSYSRISNPTVADFEQRIQAISGAKSVIALSSGMAAISNIIMALAESGSNGIISKNLFGNSVSLFQETLNQWGFEARFEDIKNIERVKAAIDNKTRFIFLETISNPQLEVVDIEEVVKIADSKNIPVILDGTVTTPYLFDAKKAGVAIEVISSTKYISGGATSVGGILTFELESKSEAFKFMDALKIVRRATNLNDNKTLVLHPASTIYCEYTKDQREEMEVSESLIRLSVGIEDSDDLIDDIKQALERV